MSQRAVLTVMPATAMIVASAVLVRVERGLEFLGPTQVGKLANVPHDGSEMLDYTIEPQRRDTVLVTDYARLPEAEGKNEQAYFGVVLEIDPATDRILGAECSCAFELGRDFFRRLVVGHRLVGDLSDLIQEVERRGAVPAQKSIIRGLLNAGNRYREFRLAGGWPERGEPSPYHITNTEQQLSAARR